MNKEVYKKAAKAAYSNSLELLEDANILYNHERYARAFALGVLSCEEFAKSFIYKCIASGIITDKNYYQDLRLHELKLSHFIHLIISNYAWSRIGDIVKKTSAHDKQFKNHSKHIFPKELDKIKNDMEEGVDHIINAFNTANDLKLRTIYVDIQKGKILVPKQFMKKQGCHAFLHVLEYYLGGFDTVLSEDEIKFRETVKALDPAILSGTVKLNRNTK